MRFIFGLILLAGLAMIAYPRLAETSAGGPIGTWRVYEAKTGFTIAEPRLAATDAPVAVSIELTTNGLETLPRGAAILTMTASTAGSTVLAKALDFAGAVGRTVNPQTQEKIFHTDVGVIDPIEAGTYTFAFGNGDAEGVSVRAVDLILSRGGATFDRRLQPVGFSLAAIGFIGLMLTFRRRGGTPPNSQPPSPRWGRGGS